MKFIKLAVAALIAGGVYVFTYWWLGSFFDSESVSVVLSFLCAVGSGWFVWRVSAKTQPSGFLTHVAVGAIVVGSLSFCAGFFGPILFWPGANQGPLLGIFFTGPAGLIVGAVGGAIYSLVKTRGRNGEAP